MSKKLYKSKECHQCGYVYKQETDVMFGGPLKNDPKLNMTECPHCKSLLFDGAGIKFERGCLTKRQQLIYSLWIKGDPEKEALHKKMLRMEEHYSESEMTEFFNGIIEEQQESIENQPKCPTCQSTNIEKISGADKAVGAVMFGLFSKTARSQFRCKNCGYKW